MLDIHERRVSQALGPAAEKMAKLGRVDFKAMLAVIFEAEAKLEPMSEAEISMRELMLSNQLDRDRIHPHSKT